MLQNPWRSFTRPNVKDLAFVLGCPSVLRHFPDGFELFNNSHSNSNSNSARSACNNSHPDRCIELPSDAFWAQRFERYLPRLQALDKNPKPLNRFLAEQLTSQRLGFRFEALILFWLQDTQFHEFELIGHNIQVATTQQTQTDTHAFYKVGSTVGELDFVVRNRHTGDIEHWELSMKFYLGHAPFMPENWVGLNENDTLAKKLTHMLHKQFRYTSVNIDGFDYRINKRRAIIKGRFFLPKHALKPSTSKTRCLPHKLSLQENLPTWLNPTLPFGLWQNSPSELTPHEASALTSMIAEKVWRRARRVEWLTKRDFLDDFELGKHPKQLADDVARFHGRRVPLTLGKGLYFYLDAPSQPAKKPQSQNINLSNHWLVIKRSS